MEKKLKKENVITLIVGVWVMISPIFLGEIPGYPGANVYMWNFFFVGIVVMITSFIAIKKQVAWAERLTLIYGVWLLLSPLFLIYFNRSEVYFWNSILSGVVISYFSALAIPFVENIIYHRHSKDKEDFLINPHNKKS